MPDSRILTAAEVASRPSSVSDSVCPCCGGTGECDACNGCDPVTATEFCLCFNRLRHVQVSGDCASFDLTFPPHCIEGVCSSPGPVGFFETLPTDYSISGGRTLSFRGGGVISCLNLGGFIYRLVISTVVSVSGCTYNGSIAFFFLALTSDCDIDSLLGEYEVNYLTPTPDQDQETIWVSLHRNEGCPP